MPEFVNVTTLTTGVPIAAETVGTASYQRVKLVGAQTTSTIPIEATSGVPGATMGAMVVIDKGGQSVTAQVSGTVSVSGSVQVSGTVTVNTAPTVAGASITIQQGVSVSAQVSGSVSVLNVVPVTTQASVSVTAFPVIWHNTAAVSINAGASVTIQQGASVSAVVSGTVTVNTAPTIAGASITIQQGASVSAVVSGTVSILNVVPVTTQASVSVTAWPVIWHNTAAVSINAGVSVTIQQGASVSAVVSGTVTAQLVNVTTTQAAVTGAVVWLAPTQTISVALASTAVATTTQASGVTGALVYLAASQTILVSVSVSVSVSMPVSGTISILSIVPATTQASVSVSGLPVWWNPTAVMNINTVVTQLGTQIVSVVPGVSVTVQQGASVSAVVSGTVSVLNVVPVVTQASASVTGIPVWLAPTQSLAVISTIVTQLGTQIVSVVPGVSVTIQQGASVTLATGTVSIAGTISTVSTITTILGTQIVTLATAGAVAALDVGRTNVMITILSTSVGISGTTMPFGLYVGQSAAVSGTTSWVVPAGKTFRILAINGVVQNSVTTSPALVRVMVLASAALPTWTSAVPIMARLGIQAVSATVAYSGCAIGIADIPAGVTVGMAHTIGTSGASIVDAQVCGFLFP